MDTSKFLDTETRFLSLPCGTCNSEFHENQIIKINTEIYSDVFFTYFDTFHFVS